MKEEDYNLVSSFTRFQEGFNSFSNICIANATGFISTERYRKLMKELEDIQTEGYKQIEDLVEYD